MLAFVGCDEELADEGAVVGDSVFFLVGGGALGWGEGADAVVSSIVARSLLGRHLKGWGEIGGLMRWSWC